MPRFSFTNSDNVVRVTPSAAAASVMLNPSGSMHWRSTKPPGCGGFFIGIVQSPSMAIEVVNVQDIAFRDANNPSVVFGTRTEQREVYLDGSSPGQLVLVRHVNSVISGQRLEVVAVLY